MPVTPQEPANPVFKDAASCGKWLAQLQLTNLQQAHGVLLTEINELNRFAMRAPDRLETLELLRDTVGHVQEEYAKKLAARPLPLRDHELVIFFALVQLWQAMALGYRRCLQTRLEGGQPPARQDALLCQRALLYTGKTICQHLHTGYEVDDRLWRQLHDLYQFAETHGLLLEKISAGPDNTPTTCHDAYLGILLTAYIYPEEPSRAQLRLLESWLPQWTGMLVTERRHVISKDDAPPLAFDMNDAQHGLQPAHNVANGENVRYVAMTPLSKLLRVKTILLQQDKTPQQVELGEIGNSRECLDLLALLHRRWCEDNDMRSGARDPARRPALLYSGHENIYARLTGKAHQQPAKPVEDDSVARKQIETYGRVLQNAPDRKPVSAEPPPEIWHIDNESIRGAQLTREHACDTQLGRHQLVALRGGNERPFVLGDAAWVKIIRTGQLQAGVRYLPGEVEAVNFQITGKSASGKFAPAFMLHAVPALAIPASLVIGRGGFEPGREIEVLRQNGEKQKVKLGFIVERGIDYERVSFRREGA